MKKKFTPPTIDRKPRSKRNFKSGGGYNNDTRGTTLMAKITAVDDNGHLIAKPTDWDNDAQLPTIIITGPKKELGNLTVGDTALISYRVIGDSFWEGTILRKTESEVKKFLGVVRPYFKDGKNEMRLYPVRRNDGQEFLIPPQFAMNLKPEELVEAEVIETRKFGLKQVRIIKSIGDLNAPRNVSLIAIKSHDIPFEFPADVLHEAEKAEPVNVESYRKDLRSIPLVTIDGEDARDFDDAVWAEPDTDPSNKGGWKLMIAIADVSYYVHPFSALDKEAFKRGNSVYFPDRVVPMLPEKLSNDLCSLRPNVDRACMAVEVTIDKVGQKLNHKFVRGVMKSMARLTYNEVEKMKTEKSSDKNIQARVDNLYGAFASLHEARRERGTLDLNIPERKVQLDEMGNVSAIIPRTQMDSNRLIEEFMILANVCAAETLEANGLPCMYRIHDEPSETKIEELRAFLDTLGFNLAKGQRLTPTAFEKVLEDSKDSPHEPVIHQTILRSQSQATYSPANIGHFGLALAKYAHFTSPIRRYADLLVHRALVTAIKAGPGGLDAYGDIQKLKDDYIKFGEHLSVTERRAAAAEWDTIDRYVASYLQDKVGAQFSGRITGVTEFGLFITLDETGADGFIPMRRLQSDFYVYNKNAHALVGRRTGRRFTLGDLVVVDIAEVNPTTGGLLLQIIQSPMDDALSSDRGRNQRRDDRKFHSRDRRERRDREDRRDFRKDRNDRGDFRDRDDNRKFKDRPRERNWEKDGDTPHHSDRRDRKKFRRDDRPFNKDRKDGDRPFNKDRRDRPPRREGDKFNRDGDRPFNKDRRDFKPRFDKDRDDRPPRREGDRFSRDGDRPFNKDRRDFKPRDRSDGDRKGGGKDGNRPFKGGKPGGFKGKKPRF